MSFDLSDILNILDISIINSMITAMPTSVPISSHIAEKIKSLVATGIVFGSPNPIPVPTKPPELMAKSDCVICRPIPSM